MNVWSRVHDHNYADTAVSGSYKSHTTITIGTFYSTNYTSSMIFKVMMIHIPLVPPENWSANPFRVIPTFTHSDRLYAKSQSLQLLTMNHPTLLATPF